MQKPTLHQVGESLDKQAAKAFIGYFENLDRQRQTDIDRLLKEIRENEKKMNWIQRNSGVLCLVVILGLAAGLWFYSRNVSKQS